VVILLSDGAPSRTINKSLIQRCQPLLVWSLLECFDCPIWKDELEKWKIDNNYELKIWNYPGKT